MTRRGSDRLLDIDAALDAIDESDLPRRQIAGMRDQLAHRYFDTSHAVLRATVRDDLPELRAAVGRLLARARTQRATD